MEPPEILAPAGNREAFAAAIDAGADAIYVGLTTLNARAYAQNFTPEELNGLRALSAQEGVKLYATINSTVKEGELTTLIKMLCQLDQIGVDAVILQDLATLSLIKRYFPRLRPHASTLMTIHNSLGITMAEKLGFRRVVIAREMSLNEIKGCAHSTAIELECFVFGAMCFTFSGLCLMSGLFGGKGSTRGRCVQPCRRLYVKGKKGKKGAFFSMLDLNVLELLHDLWAAGIRSFKIEGRLRPAHYVYHAVKAVKTILEAPRGDKKAAEEAKRLAEFALGRSSSTGFFLIDKKGASPPLNPHVPPNTGKYLGKIICTGKGQCTLSSSVDLLPGDRLRFLSRDGNAQCVKKIKGAERLKDGNWSISGTELEEAYRNGLVFLTDRKSLPFKPKKIERIPLDKRRLTTCIKEISKRAIATQQPKGALGTHTPNVWVRVSSSRDIEALMHLKEINGFYLWLDPHLSAKRVPRFKVPVTWFIPPIIYERDISHYRQALASVIKAGYRSFQIANLGALALFQRKKGLKISGSYHLNCMNSLALEVLGDLGMSGVEVSIELDKETFKEILTKSPKIPVDVVAYGYIPLFTTRLAQHPWLKPGDELKSPKGEEFLWHVRGGVGHLLFKRPFSNLSVLWRLRHLPIRRWVIDLSFGPPGWVFRRKGGGKSIFMGLKGPHRRLNLETGLF